MRAETTNQIEAIRKSIALLKRRMDWETAGHRMEEFDAMTENPDLWNDPDRAQKLIRYRQALSDSISGVEGLEQDLSDSIELIELGEMEDDAEIVSEAEATIANLVDVSAAKELESLLNG